MTNYIRTSYQDNPQGNLGELHESIFYVHNAGITEIEIEPRTLPASKTLDKIVVKKP
jgi:hypothetical protein